MKVIVKKVVFHLPCWLIFTAMLCSCYTVHPTHQTSVQQIQTIMGNSIRADKRLCSPHRRRSYRRLPDGVHTSLLPPLSHYVSPMSNTEGRFDVVANKVPAKEFFMGLVAGTNYNMVVHPTVTGTISLDLKNVTVRQTMDAIRDIYGYEYHRTSYGYDILPPQLETRIFHINYLDIQRTGRSYIQLTTGQVSNKVGTVTVGGTGSNYATIPLQTPPTGGAQGGLGTISSIETKSEMQFFKDLEKTIRTMLGKEEGHNVIVNADTGVISIRAFPRELHTISHFINSLQSNLNRQVILEAKILEVELDDTFQSGIDWSVLGNPAFANLNGTGDTQAGIGQAANAIFENTELKNLHGIFAVRFNGNFKLLIELLQAQGNVQVLSSPHISTVNNQKAVIKVGSDEFFVTGVSTTNTIIGTNTLPSQDVSLTPFFSGITLDVTPEISSDNTVTLHIHPSISRVTEQTKNIGLGSTAFGQPNTLTLPLAFSTIRESDNVVRARNGQVVVIGGLMENLMRETIVSTPWVSKVPFLGTLFRRTAQESVKSELVILLRPIIATNRNMIGKLKCEKKQFQIFKRPFHTGGLPKVFGNEAEREDRNPMRESFD